ncbi:Cupredoxin [Acephala macrosclerotiorum]|nr:Cupredoxin [Acephala macrosclerotiorum]
MHYSTVSALLSALPLALAQGYGDSGDSSTTSSAAASTTTSSVAGVHVVTVGEGGKLAFSPNSITAAVGEIVEFHFFPPKHSVAQSTFGAPCTPFSNGTSFFSGSMTTSSGENANTFQITINNTAPIWFYCAYPGHCEAGMAGVINQAANSSKTIEAYISAAASVNATVAPATVQGGVIGAAKAGSSSSSTGTGTGTATGSSSTSTATGKNAGTETRGSVRWLLLGFTGAVAVGVGSLMV